MLVLSAGDDRLPGETGVLSEDTEVLPGETGLPESPGVSGFCTLLPEEVTGESAGDTADPEELPPGPSVLLPEVDREPGPSAEITGASMPTWELLPGLAVAVGATGLSEVPSDELLPGLTSWL